MKVQFEIGEAVYLVTDPEQHERIIAGYNVRQGSIMYFVRIEMEETMHFDYEISREKRIFV